MTPHPDVERPAGLDPAFADYLPRAGRETSPPPIILDAWYGTYPDPAFRDVFDAGVDELVFGADDRQRTSDTTIAPFKWVAMLEILASDGSRWRGTGWLVSPHVVLTAGHCVYLPDHGGWASSIVVRLGVNGDDTGAITAQAFPPATATEFRSVTGWVQDQDPGTDYGAILLPNPVPSDYGSFSYEAKSDTDLVGELFNVTGYPADKRMYTQWFAARFTAGVTPRAITYRADTAAGGSGGPLYQYDGNRIAVGVHARGALVNNEAVRITSNVVRNVARWIAEAEAAHGARETAPDGARRRRKSGKASKPSSSS